MHGGHALHCGLAMDIGRSHHEVNRPLQYLQFCAEIDFRGFRTLWDQAVDESERR
jgi:hypothetical protein